MTTPSTTPGDDLESKLNKQHDEVDYNGQYVRRT